MKNLKGIILLSTVIIIVVAGYFTLINNPFSKKIDGEHVVISQAFQHLLYIGLYVAKDKGFFFEEGLNVTINTAGGDDKAFAALASGEADFAQGDPAFTAIAGERQFQEASYDSRIIVMAVNRVAMWGITFNDSIDSTDSPELFKDRIVGTYPNPNTSYVVQKQLVEEAGLTIGVDTQIKELAFGTEISAAKNMQVDIAHTIEPNATTVEAEGGKIVYSYPDAYGPLAFTGLMVSQEMIADQPETIQKVVNAYEKALRYIHSDIDGSVETAKKFLPDLDENTIRKALTRLVESESIPNTTVIDTTSWVKLLQIRVDVGDLDVMPNKSYIDNSFSTKANINGE